MYTLLNVIKFGLKKALAKENECKIYDDKIDLITRMDFLSGIYFRVFENLYLEENDPGRFKLDI